MRNVTEQDLLAISGGNWKNRACRAIADFLLPDGSDVEEFAFGVCDGLFPES